MTLVIDEETAASAEANETCSLENYLALPDHTMDERIAAARAKLGATTVILGHHYQRDEVVRFADFTGDSYKLSKTAAATGAQIHRFLRRALYGRERGRTGAKTASR